MFSNAFCHCESSSQGQPRMRHRPGSSLRMTFFDSFVRVQSCLMVVFADWISLQCTTTAPVISAWQRVIYSMLYVTTKLTGTSAKFILTFMFKPSMIMHHVNRKYGKSPRLGIWAPGGVNSANTILARGHAGPIESQTYNQYHQNEDQYLYQRQYSCTQQCLNNHI